MLWENWQRAFNRVWGTQYLTCILEDELGFFRQTGEVLKLGCGDCFLGVGNSMSKDRAWPPEWGQFKGWSMAGVLGLLLDKPLRSPLNSGSIFTFLSRELHAVPLCPVDKEVIKSQEVRKSVLWFSSSLGDGEASVLTGHGGWNRRVGVGGGTGGVRIPLLKGQIRPHSFRCSRVSFGSLLTPHISPPSSLPTSYTSSSDIE